MLRYAMIFIRGVLGGGDEEERWGGRRLGAGGGVWLCCVGLKESPSLRSSVVRRQCEPPRVAL